MNFSYFIALGLVLWVGGQKVMAGEITVGTLAQFLTFMTILQMPVRQLGLLVNAIARGATCGMRLFALLDLELAVKDRPAAPALKISAGELSFEHVSFRYPGTTRDVIKDVSFTAKRGQTIALVGPPGSGKSTLVHLIPRYYDVIERSDPYRRAERRRSDAGFAARPGRGGAAGLVPVHDDDREQHRLRQSVGEGAADRAGGGIRRSSTTTSWGCRRGYDTIVGERGVSLSGGQRQRLAIARSLVLKPAVLVFDDSTAAIDAGTEQRIRVAMRKFSEARVTIIIAHRLSSLMHADQILFLEDGQVRRARHASRTAGAGRAIQGALRSAGAARDRPAADGGGVR